LSSGLDIVRKTLGQHEIATMQTTAIDQATGMVNLTTVLAHGSGEWIASDWPVCSVAEIARPHRMGAALTYARRYALFTLVGITGEDDLDAPDLTACGLTAGREADPGQNRFPTHQSGNGRLRGSTKSKTVELLRPDQSTALRDKLLAEVASLPSAEATVAWAAGVLPSKNSLVAADAKLLEDAFEQKLAGFQSNDLSEVSTGGSAAAVDATPQNQSQASSGGSHQDRGIDKSVLAVPAPRRYRNREHLRSIAKQPCLICGRKPSDPHHLRYLQPRALGRKASDEFAVPLCRVHHRAVHRARDERAWWQAADIDPIKVARKLWKETRIDDGRMEPDPMPQTPAADRASKPGADAADIQVPD
jgi:hypothetical protein